MNNTYIREIIPSLEHYINNTLKEQSVVGAGVGIVHDQELIWAKGFGYADVSKSQIPDTGTLFRIDSNTKPFTATAIMQLRDSRRLNLGESIARYIPEFKHVAMRYGSLKDITLRRLLTHRAGLVGEPPSDWTETGIGPSEQEIIDRLGEVAIVIPPDSQQKYSNLAFMLLGQVVERLSGIQYSAYIKKNIFLPLGMDSSTLDPESSALPKVVQYVAPNLVDGEPTPVKLIHNGRRSAGGIYSNVQDMSKWISQQFRTKTARRTSKNVLSGKTLQEMHQPQYMETDWESGQCLPWRAIRRGNNIYLGHSGGNAGSLSQIFFNTHSQIGVVVLTNSDTHNAHQAIALEAMDRITATWNNLTDTTSHGHTGLPIPSSLKPLLGNYAGNRPHSGLQIAWAKNSLVAISLGESIPPNLEISSSATFPFHLDPTNNPQVFIIRDGRMAGETLKFTIGDDTKVSGILLQTGLVARKLREAY